MFRCSAKVLAVLAVLALGSVGWTQSSAPQSDSAPATAAQSGSPAQPSITGTVAYRERMALPPDAAIDVKLIDASQQDASAKTLAESVFAPGGKQMPIPFQLVYNPADINSAHVYQVRATISVNGKLMFTSSTAYPVITNGAPSQVTMMLQQATTPAASNAATKLLDTRWVLAAVNGKPAAPGQGETAHFLLHKKGKLSGSTGCNDLTGSYIAEQGALQFRPSATTMKMCTAPVMEQEKAFLAALKATTNYTISGDTLELLNNQQSLAKFQAQSKE